jgi:hypothetical protein
MTSRELEALKVFHSLFFFPFLTFTNSSRTHHELIGQLTILLFSFTTIIHFLIFLEHLLIYFFSFFFLHKHAFEYDVVFILFLFARGAEENFRITITLNKHVFL